MNSEIITYLLHKCLTLLEKQIIRQLPNKCMKLKVEQEV